MAAWSSSNQRTLEWSTAREGGFSSFRAECEAYEDALVWLAQATKPCDRTFLLTDSLRLISKLQRGQVKTSWIPLFRSIQGHFVSVYVRGHCGISYNAKADRLAGFAEPIGDLVRSPGDVTSEIARCLDGEEMRQQQGHWSTERLMDGIMGMGPNANYGARCEGP